MFKADIKQYFQTVDHAVLLGIIRKRIADKSILWLIQAILDNHHETLGKGMPLGNWTSQFFANIYLNELDQFVKHDLQVRYYIRYVDDFVILHRSRYILLGYMKKINTFLKETLQLTLHPDKCKIIPVSSGIPFLGFRIFYYHKLVRKRNLRKILIRLANSFEEYSGGNISAWEVLAKLEAWKSYAMHGVHTD